MGAIASQIISLTIVYSTVYSGADQRKHQSSASLAFVRGIHRWPVNSTRKMFPLDDVIMDSNLLVKEHNIFCNILLVHTPIAVTAFPTIIDQTRAFFAYFDKHFNTLMPTNTFSSIVWISTNKCSQVLKCLKCVSQIHFILCSLLSQFYKAKQHSVHIPWTLCDMAELLHVNNALWFEV